MNDPDLKNLSEQIECARVFDQKLVEIRRRVCEPSRLGGGTKTRAAIETIKSEAESLLESVSKLSEDLRKDNAAKKEKMEEIQNWMEDLFTQIEPLEAKGREAGLIQTNGTDDSSNIDTFSSQNSENGQDKISLSSGFYENSLDGGRKSSVPRRLFE